LQQVREALDTAWANYTSNPLGSLGSGSILVPNATGAGTRSVDTAMSTDLFGVPKAGDVNFGNYQELGKIHITDSDERPSSDYVLKAPATSNPGNSSEGVDQLFNSNMTNNTKWYAQTGPPNANNPTWVTWGYDAPITVAGYTIRTGNDMQARDPSIWQLFGSNDGSNFRLID
jgi:hypothetical protein